MMIDLNTIYSLFKPGLRLATVASFVHRGTVVADIGTDHAYLPLYLVTKKSCPRVVAVEKSQNNCENARDIICFYNQAHKIEVRCADGLKALQERDGVEVIVIAGLGGKTICQLLMAAGNSLDRYRRLVLQPMGDASLLRRWLLSRGYAIIKEKLCQERKRFYEVIVTEKGSMKFTDPFILELGPALVSGSDPLLIPWLEHKINRYDEILQNLKISTGKGNEGKRQFLQIRLKKLKDVLRDVSQRD